MDYCPPKEEMDDLIKRHSESYREFIKDKMLECTKPGDRFTTRNMTNSLRSLGHDVKELSWWRDGDFMQCVFRKVGRGKWLRTQ